MLQRVDNILYDFTVGKFYQESKQDSFVVIVDIDEKSIETLGQWPWSRVIDAELINKTKCQKYCSWLSWPARIIN